jgi:predicted aldo/keto reductase-like oxidoreductase
MRKKENRTMIYKPYGKLGFDVSAISFGGMRFSYEKDGSIEKNAALVHYAFGKGINYFDTAPGYCDDFSEKIMGAAFKTMPRKDFVVSTKCGLWNATTADEALERIDKSLNALGVDYIDIYNLWSLKTMEEYEKFTKKGGVYEGVLKARDRGLIKNICLTAHMNSADIAAIAQTGQFEGITLGYSALNFAYRQEGVEACIGKKMAVVTMNPLSGGIIPQYADRFGFINAESGDSVVVAALKFIISQKGITSALVGFNNEAEVDEALLATENLYEMTPERMAEQCAYLQRGMNSLCTGCGYCDSCPSGVPIPKLLDSYNQVVLTGDGKEAINRLKNFWDLNTDEARKCTQCGQCEPLCTQKLPIMQRISELTAFE